MNDAKKMPVYVEVLGLGVKGNYNNALLHLYDDDEHPIIFIQTLYGSQVEEAFNKEIPLEAVTIVYDEDNWEKIGWRFGKLGMQARAPIFFSKELAEWYLAEVVDDDKECIIRDCREVQKESEKYFSQGAYVILESDELESIKGIREQLIKEKENIQKGIDTLTRKLHKISPEVTRI